MTTNHEKPKFLRNSWKFHYYLDTNMRRHSKIFRPKCHLLRELECVKESNSGVCFHKYCMKQSFTGEQIQYVASLWIMHTPGQHTAESNTSNVKFAYVQLNICKSSKLNKIICVQRLHGIAKRLVSAYRGKASHLVHRIFFGLWEISALV